MSPPLQLRGDIKTSARVQLSYGCECPTVAQSVHTSTHVRWPLRQSAAGPRSGISPWRSQCDDVGDIHWILVV